LQTWRAEICLVNLDLVERAVHQVQTLPRFVQDYVGGATDDGHNRAERGTESGSGEYEEGQKRPK
jgi:hypothetical protein